MCLFLVLLEWGVVVLFVTSKLAKTFYGECLLCGGFEQHCLWGLFWHSSCFLDMAGLTKGSGGQH